VTAAALVAALVTGAAAVADAVVAAATAVANGTGAALPTEGPAEVAATTGLDEGTTDVVATLLTLVAG